LLTGKWNQILKDNLEQSSSEFCVKVFFYAIAWAFDKGCDVGLG